jgi:hypothetical protein
VRQHFMLKHAPLRHRRETGPSWERPGRLRSVLHAGCHVIRDVEAFAIHGSRLSMNRTVYILNFSVQGPSACRPPPRSSALWQTRQQ